MKRKIVAKIKSAEKEFDVSFFPEGFDLSLIEILYSDNCTELDTEMGEMKILLLAEQAGKGYGVLDENSDTILIRYKMETA